MQCERISIGMQATRDRRADTTGSAGDEDNGSGCGHTDREVAMGGHLTPTAESSWPPQTLEASLPPG